MSKADLNIRLITLGAILLATLVSAIWAPRAEAYPQFIGFGYTSCTSCHFNPLGGGPLTDYGRMLSANTIAAKPFFIDRISDDKLAENSGFLGNPNNLPDWLRPSLGYRGLSLRNWEPNVPGTLQLQWINMQADGSLVLKFLNDRLLFVGNLGYIPSSPASSNPNATLISREYYAGYLFTDNFGVYAGLMDQAFGIHIDNHEAYSRIDTFHDQNDQSDGVMLHLLTEKWEAEVQFLAGNLTQEPDLRQKGVTGTVEYEVAQKSRIGFSFEDTSNDYRKIVLPAIHGRFGFGEGSAILAQAGWINQDVTETGTADRGDYVYLQGTALLTRGVFFQTEFEYYTPNRDSLGTRYYRVGPSLDIFPMQRLEFRLDLAVTRPINGQSFGQSDLYTLLTQVHLWL